MLAAKFCRCCADSIVATCVATRSSKFLGEFVLASAANGSKALSANKGAGSCSHKRITL